MKVVLLFEARAGDADGHAAVHDAGTEHGHARFVRGGENAVFRSNLREFATQQMQKLSRRIGTCLIELTGKATDPFFGFVIFLFAGEQVPHAIDLRRFEFGVSHVWVRLKVMTAQRLVQIMKDDRARQHQHIDEAVLNHVSQQPAHAGRDQRTRKGHHDRRVVAQHVQPNPVRLRQLAAAEASAFHLFQQPSHASVSVHLDRSRGNCQVLARFWFTLCHHTVSFPFVYQRSRRWTGVRQTLNDTRIEFAAINNHDDADPDAGYH